MAIKTDNLINLSGSLSVPIDTVVQGSAKAWVNFNGTGTVAIRASFNVSSITDNGTGDYTVNFTSAMVDANYSATTSSEYSEARTTSFLNTSCRVGMYNSSGAISDATYVSVTINR